MTRFLHRLTVASRSTLVLTLFWYIYQIAFFFCFRQGTKHFLVMGLSSRLIMSMLGVQNRIFQTSTCWNIILLSISQITNPCPFIQHFALYVCIRNVYFRNWHQLKSVHQYKIYVSYEKKFHPTFKFYDNSYIKRF